MLTRPPALPDEADPPRPPHDGDAEELFQRFKEGVAQAISPDDFQSHADLAQAYKEMGLNTDALREAAVALESPKASRTALRVVLTAPLLKPGGLEELKVRLGG